MQSGVQFRARAIDNSKQLPIYKGSALVDIEDDALLQRALPAVATGMEKDEEGEIHIKVLIDQQNVGGSYAANMISIPIPEASITVDDVVDIYGKAPAPPSHYIRIMDRYLITDGVQYDADTDDEKWVDNFNLAHTTDKVQISTDEFERLLDLLEKSSPYEELVEFNEARDLLDCEDVVVRAVYQLWKDKRRVRLSKPLRPSIKLDPRGDPELMHDPYVAFRRRSERNRIKTRKHQKQDENNYDKLLKLRRDFERALSLLDLVKKRERLKLEMVRHSKECLEKRYELNDWDERVYLPPEVLEPDIVDTASPAKIKKARPRTNKDNNKRKAAAEGDSDDDGKPTNLKIKIPKPSENPYVHKKIKGITFSAGRGLGCPPATKVPSLTFGFQTLSGMPDIRCHRRRIGRGGRILFDRTPRLVAKQFTNDTAYTDPFTHHGPFEQLVRKQNTALATSPMMTQVLKMSAIPNIPRPDIANNTRMQHTSTSHTQSQQRHVHANAQSRSHTQPHMAHTQKQHNNNPPPPLLAFAGSASTQHHKSRTQPSSSSSLGHTQTQASASVGVLNAAQYQHQQFSGTDKSHTTVTSTLHAPSPSTYPQLHSHTGNGHGPHVGESTHAPTYSQHQNTRGSPVATSDFNKTGGVAYIPTHGSSVVVNETSQSLPGNSVTQLQQLNASKSPSLDVREGVGITEGVNSPSSNVLNTYTATSTPYTNSALASHKPSPSHSLVTYGTPSPPTQAQTHRPQHSLYTATSSSHISTNTHAQSSPNLSNGRGVENSASTSTSATTITVPNRAGTLSSSQLHAHTPTHIPTSATKPTIASSTNGGVQNGTDLGGDGGSSATVPTHSQSYTALQDTHHKPCGTLLNTNLHAPSPHSRTHSLASGNAATLTPTTGATTQTISEGNSVGAIQKDTTNITNKK
eukprot:CFRG5041T1